MGIFGLLLLFLRRGIVTWVLWDGSYLRLHVHPLVVNHVAGVRFQNLRNRCLLRKGHEGKATGSSIRLLLDFNIGHLAKLCEVPCHLVLCGALAQPTNEDGVLSAFLDEALAATIWHCTISSGWTRLHRKLRCL